MIRRFTAPDVPHLEGARERDELSQSSPSHDDVVSRWFASAARRAGLARVEIGDTDGANGPVVFRCFQGKKDTLEVAFEWDPEGEVVTFDGSSSSSSSPSADVWREKLVRALGLVAMDRDLSLSKDDPERRETPPAAPEKGGRHTGVSVAFDAAQHAADTAGAARGEYGVDWGLEDLCRGDMVIPGLFLGGHQASANREWLRSRGVSHIVCVGWQLEQHFRDSGEFEYLGIDIYDAESAQLYPFFEPVCKFIDAALRPSSEHADGSAGGAVFVHCSAGMSRSSTLVIAFLMKRWRCTFRFAYEHVYQRRYVVPNEGFQDQLIRWQRWTSGTDILNGPVDEELTQIASDGAEWVREHIGAYTLHDLVVAALRGRDLESTGGDFEDADSGIERLAVLERLLDIDPRLVSTSVAPLCGSGLAAGVSGWLAEYEENVEQLADALARRLFRTRGEYDSTLDWARCTEVVISFVASLAEHLFLRASLQEAGVLDEMNGLQHACDSLLLSLPARHGDAAEDDPLADILEGLRDNLTTCLDRIAGSVTAMELRPSAEEREPELRQDRLILKQSTYELCGVGYKVWPSARIMGKWMWRNRAIFYGKRVLELGAGPGALGLAAACCGAAHVRVTDYLVPIVELVDENILLNCLSDRVVATHLDFNDVVNGTVRPDDVPALSHGEQVREGGHAYDIIVAADVIYSVADVEHESSVPLVKLFARTLAVLLKEWWPQSIFYGSMQRTREGVEQFVYYAEKLGLHVVQETPDDDLLPPGNDAIWYTFVVAGHPLPGV
jgi:predicted nicotinamide N-methyase